MGSQVWIGQQGSEEWIKAPAPRTAFQATGWSAETPGRNGRTVVRKSRVTHMVYELDWPIVPTSEGQKVKDWFHGLHGRDLPIFWIDPMVENVLPAHWSMPELGCTDGRPIYGVNRPASATTASNSKGLPFAAATFTAVSGTYTAPSCYIPIPPGHTAHIGVHGHTTTAGNSIVALQRINKRANSGAATALPLIPTNSTTRFSTVVNASSTITGIELRLAPGETIGSVVLPASGTIAGMMVQIAPTGKAPRGEGFTLGGGHNGCEMKDPPVTIPISAYRYKESVSATLIEVGA